MQFKRHKLSLALAGAALALTLTGCALPPSPGENATTSTQPNTESNAVATGTAEMTDMHDKAIAVLHPTQGSKVQGKVTFTKEADGVRIVADISGLTPGQHGFHVHEDGDCSADDAASAGGHYNPANMPHGAPDSAERHAGDFGNITADDTGKAHVDMVDKVITLDGANAIIGRAVIVHAKADDLKSQPSGDAGAREACGVIGIAK